MICDRKLHEFPPTVYLLENDDIYWLNLLVQKFTED
jgi:hypothetical protein